MIFGDLDVRFWPISSFIPPLTVGMGGWLPEAEAACRDRLHSPRVGFRAGLAQGFHRYVERILFPRARRDRYGRCA